MHQISFCANGDYNFYSQSVGQQRVIVISHMVWLRVLLRVTVCYAVAWALVVLWWSSAALIASLTSLQPDAGVLTSQAPWSLSGQSALGVLERRVQDYQCLRYSKIRPGSRLNTEANWGARCTQEARVGSFNLRNQTVYSCNCKGRYKIIPH